MTKDQYFTWLNEFHDDQFKSLKEFASVNDVPIIQDQGLAFLKHLISLKQVQTILEIGTAIGYSAINMAMVNPYITVTTIERDPKMIKEAKQNIEQFELTERITLIEQDALEVDTSSFKSNVDLIFIDAAKGQYQHFFKKYTPFLNEGGIVVTDNLIFHNLVFNEATIENRNTRQLVKKIKNYNEWLKNNEEYDTYFYPIGDGIAVSIKR